MKFIICIMLFLSVCFTSSSQVYLSMPVTDTMMYTEAGRLYFNAFLTAGKTFRYTQPIAPDLYTQHLPFFCRQELKMQQAHVPLIFRLGSIDQCNYLEQKPGYK